MKTLDGNNPNSPNRNICRACGANIDTFQVYCVDCNRAKSTNTELSRLRDENERLRRTLLGIRDCPNVCNCCKDEAHKALEAPSDPS